MKVYQVLDWDSMASSMGDWTTDITYLLREKAEARAKKLNDDIDEWWHKQGCETPRYTSRARVIEIEVIE